MRDFFTWLNETQNLDERGIRTALGLYPPLYGKGQYPSLYFAPISATAGQSFNKDGSIKDLTKSAKKKRKKKSKKK